MAKMNAYQKGRQDGLVFALEIAKKSGIGELEKEIKMRGITGIHTGLRQKDLLNAIEPIRELTFDTIKALSLHALRDEFGMGKTRLLRYSQRMDFKADCLLEGFCKWKDIVDTVEKETGIPVVIRNKDGLPHYY